MKKLISLLLALTMLATLTAALAEGTPMQTVDTETLRKQAVDAGMKLPKPGEGEALYLGAGNVHFTRQTKLFLAFITSANGRSIRAAVLFGQAIEVPRAGQDPWLINNQLTLTEDAWIPLDVNGPTDIVIDPDLYTAIARLSVENGGGHCNLVLSGHYENADVGANSNWNATASLKLYNMSGETAMTAIDPPTVEQARASGMELPKTGPGESLYLGAANVSQAGAVYVAFALSENGSQMRGLTVFVKDMDVEYRLGKSKVHTTSSSCTSTINGELMVGERIDAGDMILKDFTLGSDGAECLLKYTFCANDGVEYPFDPARVRFARVK